MVFRPRDAEILTKGYKLGTSILVTKNLSREKLDPLLREWLDELETVAPVQTAIVAKSIRPRLKVKTIAEPDADKAAADEWKTYYDQQNGLVN
jgi:BioD-like phosphotransacetylase family protein